MIKTCVALVALCGSCAAGPVRRSYNYEPIAELIGWEPDFGGYHLFTERVNWYTALNRCEAAGGWLATIHSFAANNFLLQMELDAGVTGGFWIGAHRVSHGSGNQDWAWASLGCQCDSCDQSCPPSLRFSALPDADQDGNADMWIKNEPNDYLNREDCVRAGNTGNKDYGRWNDADCSDTRPYMCYIEPTTTTTPEPPTPSPTTSAPTSSPTTSAPTSSPTESPTTSSPTRSPTDSPTTSAPTQSPTTSAPTSAPTQSPTTSAPTSAPTESPTTSSPTQSPTTSTPTTAPTDSPTTSSPTSAPTDSPTVSAPTAAPTNSPTTSAPTLSPTIATTTTTEEPITTTRPHPPQEWSYNPNSGCWYIEIRDDDRDHQSAQTACQAFQFEGTSAHLAAPTNLIDAEFIGALGERAKPAWNAGKWNGSAWIYIDGTEWNVESWDGWYEGEPNGDPSTTSLCVQRGIARNKADTEQRRFNDNNCGSLQRYTCQFCYATASPTTAPTDSPTTSGPTAAPTDSPTTSAPTASPTDSPTTSAPTLSPTTSAPTAAPTDSPTTTAPTQGPTPMPLPDWNFFPETGCFYTQPDVEKTNWAGALEYCDGLFSSGGEDSFLAIIETRTEAQFVAAFETRNGNPRWIGAQRDPTSGQQAFRDINGKWYAPDFWYPGEPTDISSGDDCVAMGYAVRNQDTHPYKLNDARCSNTYRMICEWCPPRGSTTTTTTPEPPTNSPTTSSPSNVPTASPTTSSPTATPTSSPTTSSPTAAPTSSPSPAETTTQAVSTVSTEEQVESTPTSGCPVPSTAEEDALRAHNLYIASVLSTIEVRLSGRGEAVKTTCEDYCSQRAFGVGCRPCALETLTSEEACLFSGPFGTGKLCHFDPASETLTAMPCCMRYRDGVTPGNMQTTCKVPKRECDCDTLTGELEPFNYAEAFPASQYLPPLARWWDASTNTCKSL